MNQAQKAVSGLSWSRPSPHNLWVRRTFYRNRAGNGRHAVLYRDNERIKIRTLDASLVELRVEYRGDLKAAQRLVAKRAARGGC